MHDVSEIDILQYSLVVGLGSKFLIVYGFIQLTNDPLFLYKLMDSSFFDTINFGIVHCIYRGVRGYNFQIILHFFSLNFKFVFSNVL